MAYTLGNKYVKNLCKRIVLPQLIIENVVTCFLEHSVDVAAAKFCTVIQPTCMLYDIRLFKINLQ